MDYREIIEKQITLLADWNKKECEAFTTDIEQVRRNTEAIIQLSQHIADYFGFLSPRP